jgi:hypothetical protein
MNDVDESALQAPIDQTIAVGVLCKELTFAERRINIPKVSFNIRLLLARKMVRIFANV